MVVVEEDLNIFFMLTAEDGGTAVTVEVGDEGKKNISRFRVDWDRNFCNMFSIFSNWLELLDYSKLVLLFDTFSDSSEIITC